MPEGDDKPDVVEALWEAMRSHFPGNAEIRMIAGYKLSVSWSMPEDGRPNRRSREIVIVPTRDVIEALLAADAMRRSQIAERAADTVGRSMSAYSATSSEPLSFRIHVDTEALDR